MGGKKTEIEWGVIFFHIVVLPPPLHTLCYLPVFPTVLCVSGSICTCMYTCNFSTSLTVGNKTYIILDILNLLSMLYCLVREGTVVLKTSFVMEESMAASMKVGHCHMLEEWSHDSYYVVTELIAVVQFDCNSRADSGSIQTACSQLCNTSKQNFQCLMKVRLPLFWIQILGNYFNLDSFNCIFIYHLF
jgi:hypothetical protein